MDKTKIYNFGKLKKSFSAYVTSGHMWVENGSIPIKFVLSKSLDPKTNFKFFR